MKKSHECEVATHIDPESCGAVRKSGETPRAGTGRSHVRPGTQLAWDASGSLRTHADDERTWEVGQPYSTWEVPEQGRTTGGGGDGGKRTGQREPAPAKRVPDTEPDRRAQCAQAGRSSRQGCETYGVKASIARFGRIAYPVHVKVTTHVLPGCKRHGCPMGIPSR